MQSFEWIHAGWLLIAIVLEIAANIFLKHSDGFRRLGYGLLSLLSVLAAFSALAQAVKGIELSVAYALWGGLRHRCHRRRGLDPVRPAAELEGLAGAGYSAGGYGDY